MSLTVIPASSTRQSTVLRIAIALLSVGLLLLAGCRDDLLVRPSAESPVALLALDGQQIAIRPEEAAFAELALAVPGSAGFFLDESGRLVVVVRDPEDDVAALTALRGIVNSRVNDARVRSAELAVQRGEYSFFELAVWRDAVFDNILGRIEGVISLDLKESTNRVVIGVLRYAETAVRSTLPSQLMELGIDTGAVVFSVHDRLFEPARKYGTPVLGYSHTLFGDSVGVYAPWDTIVGGIPVMFQDVGGQPQSCSLGVVVDRGGTRGMVSASHCTRSFWYLDQGDDGRMFQPDTMRVIGFEQVDPGSWNCGLLGQNACRNSDASFFSAQSGIPSHRGLIARTMSAAGPGSSTGGSRTVNPNRPYFIIDSVDDDHMIEGQYVHKIGQTTGWTWGTITDTCYDSSIGWLFTLVIKCTYQSNMPTDGGDSGAPVFALYGNGLNQNTDLVRLVGIVATKSGTLGDPGFRSMFSKWNRVQMDLGAMNATRGTALSAPSLSGGTTFTYPSLSWPSVSGATQYQLFRVKNGITEALGIVTGTSTADGDTNVLEYLGATEPTSGQKIQYYIYALSATENSPKSNVIWYRGASGHFSVTVNGPSVVGPNNAHCSTWMAQVTGADTIISYDWSGFFTSSDSYVQGTIPQTGAEFQLLVVDSQDRQGGYVMQVTYDPEHTDDCV